MTCLPRGISGADLPGWGGLRVLEAWSVSKSPVSSQQGKGDKVWQAAADAKQIWGCRAEPPGGLVCIFQHNTGTLNPTELSASLRPYPRGSIQLASQLGTEHRFQIFISGDSTIRRHSSHPITDRNTGSLCLKTGIISKAGSLSTAGM